ncbi:MAG: ankyrin repeat domain-containing RING finger protein [Tatlockia sp.]|jgi:hypothetical protein
MYFNTLINQPMYFKNKNDEAKLFKAIASSDYSYLNELSSRGVLTHIINVRHQGTHNTPLMEAVFNNNVAMVNYLIGVEGVNVNMQKEGLSVLEYAAQNGQANIVTLLVNAAWPYCEQDSEKAAQLAQDAGNIDIAKQLWALLPHVNRNQTPESSIQPGNTMRLAASHYTGKIDDKLICPISRNIMDDPIAVSSGIFYDRHALAQYFESEKKECVPCPVTRYPLAISELSNKTNVVMKELITEFLLHCEQEMAKNKEIILAEVEEPPIKTVPEARLRLFEPNQANLENKAQEKYEPHNPA